MKTIGVALWGGQQRDGAQNKMTCVRSAAHPDVVVRGPARSLRQLFVDAYPMFAGACREVDEPGVALVAIDERSGRACGLVQLRARVDRHVAAIVGRHNRCDMFLDANDRLALRQLAIVLDPVTSWRANEATVRFHVLDLRTNQPFTDESGREMRGLRCEGPALLRVSGYALFLLPLGDRTDWPASGSDAWSCLPERVYFDEQSGPVPMPRGSSIGLPLAPVSLRHSAITRTAGPRDTGMRLVDRDDQGDLAGMLELGGARLHGAIAVGHDALRDGILLGRYARCDSAALADDPSLSRVHALLLQIDDSLLVIDTASRNGTKAYGDTPQRVITLRGETELQLGWSTRARWRWVA